MNKLKLLVKKIRSFFIMNKYVQSNKMNDEFLVTDKDELWKIISNMLKDLGPRLNVNEPDILAMKFKRRIKIECNTEKSYTIVGLIDDSILGKAICLTDNNQIICLHITHAAQYSNGITQIYGAPPGIMILTYEMIAMSSQKKSSFIKGDIAKTFTLERLHDNKIWQKIPFTFTDR